MDKLLKYKELLIPLGLFILTSVYMLYGISIAVSNLWIVAFSYHLVGAMLTSYKVRKYMRLSVGNDDIERPKLNLFETLIFNQFNMTTLWILSGLPAMAIFLLTISFCIELSYLRSS